MRKRRRNPPTKPPAIRATSFLGFAVLEVVELDVGELLVDELWVEVSALVVPKMMSRNPVGIDFVSAFTGREVELHLD